jgi:hypothetical protein
MANTVLTRTPSGTGNQKKWTYSIWFKRQHTNTESALFSVGDNPSTNMCMLRFDPDKINFYSNDSNAGRFSTNQLFRDINGFYHVVLAYDSANATTDNRLKFYVNGQRISTSDMTGVNTVVQNTDSIVNSTSTIYIGERPDDNAHFDGIMSHIHFCDGYAYDASDFGEYDTNGVWKIKTSPSVTYGTNGFFILKNGNSVTDQSGNSNNFTVAGGTLTNTEDSPSNVFATLNPLIQLTDATLSNGNNSCAYGSASSRAVMLGTLGMSSGKYYMEFKISASSASPCNGYLGIINGSDNSSMGTYLNQDNSVYQAIGYQGDGAKNLPGNVSSSYGDSFTTGDIIGVAVDIDNKALYFSKNGTFQNSGNPTSGASKTGAIDFSSVTDNGFWFPIVSDASGTQTMTYQCNFGNGYFGTTAVASAGTNASGIGIFEYDVPTGFTALSTKGLNL